MDLIKCPDCGEYYSPSYHRCPFCEENEGDPNGENPAPKRRITSRQKAQSARGAMILAMLLVLALFGWYLFSDKLAGRGGIAEPEQTGTAENEPSVPASNPDATDDPFFEPGASETAEPDANENADVSNAKLSSADFTLSSAGEAYTIKLSGTEAADRQIKALCLPDNRRIPSY